LHFPGRPQTEFQGLRTGMTAALLPSGGDSVPLSIFSNPDRSRGLPCGRGSRSCKATTKDHSGGPPCECCPGKHGASS